MNFKGLFFYLKDCMYTVWFTQLMLKKLLVSNNFLLLSCFKSFQTGVSWCFTELIISSSFNYWLNFSLFFFIMYIILNYIFGLANKKRVFHKKITFEKCVTNAKSLERFVLVFFYFLTKFYQIQSPVSLRWISHLAKWLKLPFFLFFLNLFSFIYYVSLHSFYTCGF